MAKNLLFNIGKSLFKEVSEKLIEQGKETLYAAGNELLEKGKETVVNSTNQKMTDLKDNFLGGSTSFKSKDDTFVKQNTEEKAVNQFVEQQRSASVEVVHAEVVYDEKKYHDAEQFEKNLHSGLNGLAAGLAAGNPAAAAEVLNNLVSMAGEVSKFTEVQKTKRKEIEAQRDIYVTKINAQKEVMLTYLEKSFDERKENFRKLFEVVDHAIANNNMQQLAVSLESINQLAASSPFKDLASIESTQQALTDKNYQWDF